MSIRLNSLLLSPEELKTALRQVRESAYFKWEAVGRPVNRDLDFWCAAEREWIAHYYVPHRLGDDRENAVGSPPAGAPASESRRAARAIRGSGVLSRPAGDTNFGDSSFQSKNCPMFKTGATT
jgi:hypothetical protein